MGIEDQSRIIKELSKGKLDISSNCWPRSDQRSERAKEQGITKPEST